MSNPAKHPRPTAEVHIHGAEHLGHTWSVLIDGRRLEHSGLPVRARTEALWLAIDAIRDDRPDGAPHRGIVAIYSPGARQVAYAPLWSVPQYQLLQWMDPWAPQPAQDIELVEHAL